MKRKRKLSLKTASDVVKAHDCEAIAYELVTKVYLNRTSARKPAAISLVTLSLSSIANELYLNSAQGGVLNPVSVSLSLRFVSLAENSVLNWSVR